ncbi:hypothetical protein AMS68_005562 [Peltaster fructicola]|uniref:ADP-ribosylation factor GTPase-activating protein n=1 Tax=Peltaster fructicola TaxID=286661 RepID=A0A6H0XZE9_9PEZI|nr:hypothetical protein AMS68_005562 [Peltaster fructicola]
MGAASSRADDGSPVYVKDPNKFSIAAVTITNARNQMVLRITPDAFPVTRYHAQRDLGDDTPVEFVQDLECTASAAPSFLLRLTNLDELTFNFVIHIRQQHTPNGNVAQPTTDTHISGLTFISGSTSKEVENMVVREFHADPNIHKSPNVHLLGDYTTGGSTSVQVTWTWKWQPPKALEDKGNGWRNSCSFVEYDQRTDKLNILAGFSFWVQNSQRYLSTGPRSPRFEMSLPPRLRVPSSHSIESRFSNVSDSEGEGAPVSLKELREPQSPIFQTIPEDGLGLVNSATVSTPGPVKVDVATVKPGEDPSTNEDGPLFRATMRSLEQKTGNMRLRMKKVLRTAEAAQAAQVNCNNAVKDFTEALREASTSNANAVQPALDHYFEKIAREILLYERQNTANLQRLIIDPVSKLYNNEIKQADFKKREFDEESKEYYAYTSKYLGQRSESVREKKQKHTDEKYQAKRRTFELKRFDYSSFMHDLHGGRKDQEVLSQLTKYADAQARGYLATAKKVEEMMPQLEALISEVRSAERDYQIQRTEREEKRRVLEKSTKLMSEDGAVVPTGNLGHSTSQNGGLRANEQDRAPSISASSVMSTSPPSVAPSAPTASSLTAPSINSQVSTSPSSKFKGFRDLEESSVHNGGTFKKEGLLWALSRPSGAFDAKAINKQGWHKFWIVLDQGKLSEYVNWKDKLDLHMDPIDLRMASVREARSSERRFCFEVITPQFTRVYQAPSEEDMKAWIGAVNNALQSAFEARGAVPAPTPAPSSHSTRKDIAAVLTGKSTSFHGHRQASNPNRRTADSAVHRYATTGDRPPSYRRADTTDAEPNVLLQRIRNADEGNKLCADCGNDSKVDWCSINLGILLCIECSGIHRSLGTHISKVRSLTLDTSVFTPDIVEILLLIGNRVSNMIWEAKLDQFLKPAAHSTREQRLHFITAKYADRAYAATTNSVQTPDELLLTSIKRNDIQSVVQALALRANPNAHDRSRSTHAVYLALAAADPASPATTSFSHSRSGSTPTMTPPAYTPPRSTTPTQRKPFPIAEVLLQNGADVPTEAAPIPLSAAARIYLDYKADLRAGRVGVGHNNDNAGAIPQISIGTPPAAYGTSAPPNVPSAGGIRIGDGPRMLKRQSRQSVGMSNDGFEVFGRK